MNDNEMSEDTRKTLLQELEDGTKHALICSLTPPPKGTPWESVKDSCALCGKPLWRDARNTELMKTGNMIPVCIPCALPHIGPDSIGSGAIAGQMMTLQEAVEAVFKHRGMPPEREPDA